VIIVLLGYHETNSRFIFYNFSLTRSKNKIIIVKIDLQHQYGGILAIMLKIKLVRN